MGKPHGPIQAHAGKITEPLEYVAMNNELENPIVRRLVRQNRTLIATLAAMALIWAGSSALSFLRGVVRRVETTWRADKLVVDNITGHLLVTGLAGESGGVGVGARLPRPVLILDSEGAAWTETELSNLEWLNEGGGKMAAPKRGSAVRALFVRLESSDYEAIRSTP
jgi:hypothetical protein